MATTYNTLSLESKATRKTTRPIAAYLVAGLIVVALAGAGSYFVSTNGHLNLVEDGVYDDFKADVVFCWENAEGDEKEMYITEPTIPKYDREFSSKVNGDRAFYNACYYSYSCCTETTEACLTSNGYGEKCEACLFNNGPRMVLPICSDFLRSFSKDGSKPEAGQTWGEANLLADTGFPTTNEKTFKERFKEITEDKKQKLRCWRRVGAEDTRMRTFVKNCWDAISWCNLLCPRDDYATVQEKMCKECINLGFQKQAPKKYTNIHNLATFKKDVWRWVTVKNPVEKESKWTCDDPKQPKKKIELCKKKKYFQFASVASKWEWSDEGEKMAKVNFGELRELELRKQEKK